MSRVGLHPSSPDTASNSGGTERLRRNQMRLGTDVLPPGLLAATRLRSRDPMDKGLRGISGGKTHVLVIDTSRPFDFVMNNAY